MNGKADRLPDGFDKRVREPYTVAELEEIFSTVDVNARGGYSEEPAISMRAVDLAGATWLLDHGADLEALSRFQKAPLATRAGHRSPRIVALLIQRGATVDAHPSSGETALQVAAKQLDLESVEVLLDAGADPRNSFGYRGDNALDCAAFGVTEHGGSGPSASCVGCWRPERGWGSDRWGICGQRCARQGSGSCATVTLLPQSQRSRRSSSCSV